MQTSARRIRAYLLLTLIGLIFVLAFLLCGTQATSFGAPWEARALAGAGAILLLSVPAWIGYAGIKRRFTTGRWSVGPEEQAKLARRLASRKSGLWGTPWVGGILLATALLNVFSAVTRVRKHPGMWLDGVFLVFWIAFAAAQAFAFCKALQGSARVDQGSQLPPVL